MRQYVAIPRSGHSLEPHMAELAGAKANGA
jgi:hypothetical protein